MRKDYSKLVEQYKAGKAPKEVLKDNPGFSKSGLYAALKKEQPAVQQIPEPLVPELEPPVVAAPVVIQDTFLNDYKDTKNSSKMKWESKEERLDRLFGSIEVPSYGTQDLAKVGNYANAEPEANTFSSMKGKGLNFWTKQPKTQKELAKEEYEKQENERLALIQKIRLYMYNFPDLHELDEVITIKNKDGSNNVKKWLTTLYSKKTEDLEKTLHFIQFHTRNTTSDNGTGKVVESVFEISIRAIEMILCALSLKVHGLTQEMMADPDVARCLKEIMIESSIHSHNFGPKTDLIFKLGTKIATVDTMNRVIEAEQKKLNQAGQPNQPVNVAPIHVKAAETTNKLGNTLNAQLKEKFSDL